MRPFIAFDADAPDERVAEGRAARLRADTTLLWLALVPAFAFVRQRSNFILGWEAAAAAGAAASGGAAAGAVGAAGVPALGSWMMLPDLTTPATATVLPMNDALYGACHIELDRQGPMVVHVPADPDDRYYSVAILDGQWANVAHLGPKWTGRDEVEVLLVPPGWVGQAPEGMRVIESPTASVCLLCRCLVRYDEGDLDRVRTWRSGFTVRPWDGDLVDVEQDDLLHPDIASIDDPWEYVAIGLDHVARNPFSAEMSWVLDTVDVDGIIAAEHDEVGRAAVIEGVEAAQAAVDAALTTWPTHDGWRLPQPWVGLPTAHVVENAGLQLFQVGSNDLGEAAYFFGDHDDEGRLLDGSDGAVYRLRFSVDELPPVGADGFWSLTMYGLDNLLVDNPIDRYSTRVTRPGFTPDPDGAVTFWLSATKPEHVDQAAWLPAPSGRFRLGLRLYYPLSPVVDGTWQPPAPHHES